MTDQVTLMSLDLPIPPIFPRKSRIREVTLEVSNPGGGEADLFFDQAGGMVYEHGGKRYFRAEKPGKYTITVCAVNENFLVSRKSLVIEVE